MRILVTGAAGQLGSTIVQRFQADADVRPYTRASLDLSEAASVMEAVAGERPDVILNCAAFNDVDGAEEAAETALRVNALGPLSLARAAAAVGATFINYSTDFVFDGTAKRPYDEDDAVNPQSVYAASKLIGEWFTEDAVAHYVLRVESLFGGTQRRSSVDRIVDAIRQGRSARVFVDRTVSPSFVEDVADATWALITRRPAYGLYHCVNTGATTWHALAVKAAEILEAPANLVPVSVADVKLRAQRPMYCALSNDKLRRAGIDMPTWEDALRRYLRRV